jgi:hypothetical protein
LEGHPFGNVDVFGGAIEHTASCLQIVLLCSPRRNFYSPCSTVPNGETGDVEEKVVEKGRVRLPLGVLSANTRATTRKSGLSPSNFVSSITLWQPVQQHGDALRDTTSIQCQWPTDALRSLFGGTNGRTRESISIRLPLWCVLDSHRSPTGLSTRNDTVSIV